MKNLRLKSVVIASLCAYVAIFTTASADTVGICVTKKTGAVKGVLNPAKCNKKTETFVALNSVGLAGTPGIPGVKGDKGDQGIPGPKGDSTAVGNDAISVYDANNQFLGTSPKPLTTLTSSEDAVLDYSSEVTAVSVFVPAPISAYTHISLTDGSMQTLDPNTDNNYPLVAPGHTISGCPTTKGGAPSTTCTYYYTSSNCSDAVFNATTYSYPLVKSQLLKGIGSAAGKFFIYKIKTSPAGAVTLNSFQQTINGTSTVCNSTEDTTPVFTVAPTYELKEVPAPFNLPIALPLRYE
jgi:hypothetical protein